MKRVTSDRARRTMNLCYTLARHLSTRKECRGEEYALSIYDGIIMFSPNISVFPDKHTRKVGTKLPVLDHVLQIHFPSCNYAKDKFGTIQVDPEHFVNGIFRYSPSVDKRSRKWFRVM